MVLAIEIEIYVVILLPEYLHRLSNKVRNFDPKCKHYYFIYV